MVSLCFDNEKIKTLNFWLDSKGVEIHLLKKFWKLGIGEKKYKTNVVLINKPANTLIVEPV